MQTDRLRTEVLVERAAFEPALFGVRGDWKMVSTPELVILVGVEPPFEWEPVCEVEPVGQAQRGIPRG